MFKINKFNKEKFKGIIIGSIMTSIITTSIFSFAGGMENISAFFNDIKIKINGKIIDTANDEPFIYNGRTYVPARYVAEGLGASVKWNETSNTVEIDSVGNINSTPISNISNKTGSIKGAITWQYNNIIGTKPDTDAKIALIPENLKPLADNEFFCLLVSQNPQGKNGIYTTNADGYGNYEIQDIPIGNYYLLIISKNTKSDLTVQPYDKQRLKPLFTENGWNNLETNMKLGKVELRDVEIKENKMINESYDFGNTYY